MATLKSKIQISSSDFFSQSLNLSTSTTTSTSGDDRAFSVERVELGVRPTSTLTQSETALANSIRCRIKWINYNRSYQR